MNLSKIDLNLFTVFDAIYRERGITAASKRLHLSQPAVSHALARLREALSDQLFERQGNEMIPTPRARELASAINPALINFEKILQSAATFDPLTCQRSFTVSMRAAHEAAFLPRMLDALNREAPHVCIGTVRIERRELEEDLQSGDIDVAIDMPLAVSNDIRRQCIRAEPLVVLARRNHPNVKDSLDLAAYLAMEHVLVSGRRHGVGYEDSALQRLNLVRHIRVRCQQHAAANEVVSRSNLLATMPQSYAEYVNRHVGNQLLPFPIDIPMLEFQMYWHVNVADDPAHRWFRELALKFF
ncbi:MAG TPA: LysR family transcriptional regulator [Steroidobacteraceae bacterium]|nr:LysR family transcriptional regulator [Steroidobacteraceae bacterium]